MPSAAAILLAAAIAAAAPSSVPDVETLAGARDVALRLTVPTRVNGQGPFFFTVDTGADRSVVSDRLAAALALPPGRPVTMHGLVGAEAIGTVRLDRLRIGRAERRDVSAPVLPEHALGATGFLGIDVLANQNVVLDFRRNRITLSPSRAEDVTGEIVVTGRSRFGQLILTDARIMGRKVYAIIDTGAQNTVGNMALHALVHGKAPFTPGEGLLIGVTGAELPAQLGYVPRVQLGGLTITNMPVAFAAAHSFERFGVGNVPALLIGMDVLRGFRRVALDFRRREARFLLDDAPASTG